MKNTTQLNAAEIAAQLKELHESKGRRVKAVSVTATMQPVGYGMQESDQPVVEATVEWADDSPPRAAKRKRSG